MLQTLDPNSTMPAETLPVLSRLSDDARALAQPDLNVRGFVDALIAQERYGDVVDVLTHLLPRPYAVAWGYECLAELAQQSEPAPSDLTALAVTKRWLAEPSEDNRRAALELSDRLGFKGPGAWLVTAAGWTAGNMLPPGQPEVPVAPSLAGDAVGAALRCAAATDPARFNERMATFVRKALAAFAPAGDGTARS